MAKDDEKQADLTSGKAVDRSWAALNLEGSLLEELLDSEDVLFDEEVL